MSECAQNFTNGAAAFAASEVGKTMLTVVGGAALSAGGSDIATASRGIMFSLTSMSTSLEVMRQKAVPLSLLEADDPNSELGPFVFVAAAALVVPVGRFPDGGGGGGFVSGLVIVFVLSLFFLSLVVIAPVLVAPVLVVVVAVPSTTFSSSSLLLLDFDGCRGGGGGGGAILLLFEPPPRPPPVVVEVRDRFGTRNERSSLLLIPDEAGRDGGRAGLFIVVLFLFERPVVVVEVPLTAFSSRYIERDGGGPCDVFPNGGKRWVRGYNSPVVCDPDVAER
jgi:hypothetical protein